MDLEVEFCGASLSGGCFFSLYGCNERTRVLGLFLREFALDPLMTFGRLDLTVVLALGTATSMVVITVSWSLNDLRGLLLVVF